MSKTEKCIKMLQILSSGKTYKKSELAYLLGTNPRNILEYKKELEEASWAENENEVALDYHILSEPGKNGGYKLDRSITIPTIKLNINEKLAFMEGVSYLEGCKDFVNKKEFILATAKINSAIENNEELVPTTFVSTTKYAMEAEEIQKRYIIISECIKEHKVCIFQYRSSDNVVRERVVCFYKLFLYNNSWFAIGYDKKYDAIRYFKLVRILEIKKSTEGFKEPSKYIYNERDYFDEKGFKVGRDWGNIENQGAVEKYHIKLKLEGIAAMYVKDYIYGENQTITEVDQNTTILECDMQYKYNTMKFVLGFGKDCEVIEPKWLREDLKNIAGEIIKKYT